MSKYHKVLVDGVNVMSANRCFRTMQSAVATYEQTKKTFSYFYTKTEFREDGKHNHPLEK